MAGESDEAIRMAGVMTERSEWQQQAGQFEKRKRGKKRSCYSELKRVRSGQVGSNK